jgi:hypothetical protein
MVTTSLVLLSLIVASSALALDLPRKNQPIPGDARSLRLESVNAVLGCDDGVADNAYFQDTNWRLGNLFDFGGGAVISTLQFVHFGYGFAGPYNYNIELWDPTSCTLISGVNGLVAQNAATALMVETVGLCPQNLYASGPVMVTIDPNSCLAANDCYPDLMYDDQIGVFCPVIVDATVPAAADCYDQSSVSGPFLLRVETNNCPTPSRPGSWGGVKVLYR